MIPYGKGWDAKAIAEYLGQRNLGFNVSEVPSQVKELLERWQPTFLTGQEQIAGNLIQKDARLWTGKKQMHILLFYVLLINAQGWHTLVFRMIYAGQSYRKI